MVDCPEALEIDSYPGVFAQILTHLILNSLIHGFEHHAQGTIRVQASVKPDGLWLRYSDNGKGIPKEDQARIFEPFYTTKRNQGSIGLGLHIVYNLVTQKLRGHIECDSTPGAGVTFVMQIPVDTPLNPARA